MTEHDTDDESSTETKTVEVTATAVGYDEVDVESVEDVMDEMTVEDARFEVNNWEVYDSETDEITVFER